MPPISLKLRKTPFTHAKGMILDVSNIFLFLSWLCCLYHHGTYLSTLPRNFYSMSLSLHKHGILMGRTFLRRALAAAYQETRHGRQDRTSPPPLWEQAGTAWPRLMDGKRLHLLPSHATWLCLCSNQDMPFSASLSCTSSLLAQVWETAQLLPGLAGSVEGGPPPPPWAEALCFAVAAIPYPPTHHSTFPPTLPYHAHFALLALCWQGFAHKNRRAAWQEEEDAYLGGKKEEEGQFEHLPLSPCIFGTYIHAVLSQGKNKEKKGDRKLPYYYALPVCLPMPCAMAWMWIRRSSHPSSYGQGHQGSVSHCTSHSGQFRLLPCSIL